MAVSTTKFGDRMKMTVSWLTLTFAHDRFILELKRSRASHHIARRAEREPPPWSGTLVRATHTLSATAPTVDNPTHRTHVSVLSADARLSSYRQKQSSRGHRS